MSGPANDVTAPNTRANLRAVVDIGSNSVRLVVYDGPLRSPIAICNEKALCGLGRDAEPDGGLNKQAVIDALSTLTRFRRLLAEYGEPPVQAFATAAVRDAPDGADFVKAVKKIGLDVKIITGAEEAELAAYGVTSFEPNATGIAGDMGGGSLELVTLKGGRIKDNISLPIGPFNIMRESKSSIPVAEQLIEKELDSVALLKKNQFETLYCVGGAWRAVARIHMRLRNYPLSVLHRYELTTKEAFEICDLVSRQSRRSLEEIPGIPKRRLDTLPYASIVLKSVLSRMNAKRLVVSAGGVREGLLFRDLKQHERKKDPLIEGCRFYAARLAPDPSFGDVIWPAIDDFYREENSVPARVRQAACLLVDVGAYFHPDLRAMQAFDTALRAPLVGISHPERVWIALALFRRHEGRTPAAPDEQAISLLTWAEQQDATKFGLLLRFLAALSPKSATGIKGVRLKLEDEKLTVVATRAHKELMGETPTRRFEALAAAFESEPAYDYSG